MSSHEGNPRKKAASKAEVAERVAEILSIRLDGAEFHDIEAFAKEKRWDVSPRQLWRYIAAADDLLVERQVKKRNRLIARHVSQRQALYARALNASDHRTALAVLADLARMQGLYPDKDWKELARQMAEQNEQIKKLLEERDDPRNNPPSTETESNSDPGTAAGPPEVGCGTGDVQQ